MGFESEAEKQMPCPCRRETVDFSDGHCVLCVFLVFIRPDVSFRDRSYLR